MVAPRYPVAAARDGVSGYAVTEFSVGPAGVVTNVHVIASSPKGVFDAAAIEAIRESTFEPALQNGQQVTTAVTHRSNFTLNN